MPTIWAAASPSAHVRADAYERIAARIVDGIKAAGFDFDIGVRLNRSEFSGLECNEMRDRLCELVASLNDEENHFRSLI